MSKRTTGFISANDAFDLVERSIKSAENWKEKTKDAFNTSERIESLEGLFNILVELTWRYGDAVKFQFTTRTVANDIQSVETVLWDSDIPEQWARRVKIDESNMAQPLVYIKF